MLTHIAAAALAATTIGFTPQPAPDNQTACVTVTHRFVVGKTDPTLTVDLGQELPAGDYQFTFSTYDAYLKGVPPINSTTDRADTPADGQKHETVTVKAGDHPGIGSADLEDGVNSAEEITTGQITSGVAFDSVTIVHTGKATHRDSVTAGYVCLKAVEKPEPTTTTTEIAEHPPTTITDTIPPTTAQPTTQPPTTQAATSTTKPAPATTPQAPPANPVPVEEEELAYTGADHSNTVTIGLAGIALLLVAAVAIRDDRATARNRRN